MGRIKSKVSVNNRKTKMVALGKSLRMAGIAADLTAYKTQKQKERFARIRRNAMVRTHKMPYYANQNVLLVGEANCSFARALIRGYRKRISMCDSFKDLRHKARQAKGVEAVPLSDDEGEDEVEVDEDEDEEEDEDFDEDEDNEEEEEEEEEEDMVDDDEDEADEDEEEEDDDEDGFSGLSNSAAARARRAKRDARVLLTPSTCGKNLLVTCYDSLEESLAKYPDLPEILSELHSAGARVVFGVDATTLVSTLSKADLIPKERFDRIVFNFPHVGSGETDKEKSVAENQELLLRFLSQTVGLLRKPKNAPSALAAAGAAPLVPAADDDSRRGGDDDDDDAFLSRAQVGAHFDARNPATAARIMALAARGKDTGVTEAIAAATAGRRGEHRRIKLDRGGEVHITLKTGHPYDRWRPTLLARTLNDAQSSAQEAKEAATGAQPGSLWGRFPRLALTRCLPFLHEAYSGYSHRRTLGYKAGVAANEDIMKADGSKTWMFTRALPGMSQGLEGDEGERKSGPSATVPVRTERRHKNKMYKRRGKNKVSRRGW